MWLGVETLLALENPGLIPYITTETSFSSLNMLKYVIRCTYIIIWEKYTFNKWGKPHKFLNHRDQVLYKDWRIHERTHG